MATITYTAQDVAELTEATAPAFAVEYHRDEALLRRFFRA